MAALYVARLSEFVVANSTQLIGSLNVGLAREGFDTSKLTNFSWQSEISELQDAFRTLLDLLSAAREWWILLEYVLPVVGLRVDCVLIARDVIYAIEYKGGDSANAHSALRQAQDYALNLLDFHEASRRQVAIPIAVGAFRRPIHFDMSSENRGAAINACDVPAAIIQSFERWGGNRTMIDVDAWNTSRYFPVPTIIEAASAIYRNHDVKALARSREGIDNLETTQKAIAESVRDAKCRQVKKLLIITGVPGAGKTLAGLNAVQLLAQELDSAAEHASFVTGNGPLVKVLQEALKRSVNSRKKGLARSIRSRIREVHNFVRDSYEDSRPPADRMIVFDEAQRAWTPARNLRQFGRDVSEPEMVLKIMSRHSGWAVIAALVGGGQEIHAGEAGLAAWGDAITRYPEWEIVTSPEALLGGSSVAGSRLFRNGHSEIAKCLQEPAFHLSVSRRSFETEVTAAWVNAVLEGDIRQARELAGVTLPIFVTRDIDAARTWLHGETTGTRRAGLIASSGAARLRADGVETPTFKFLGGIDYVKWFLEPSGDYRSSNQLEIALSEFELQGLELDFVGLLWGGDLVFPNGEVVARKLSGTTWRIAGGRGDPQASADDLRTRIQNKYRVLLTRFRKNMVIFVPNGSTEDPTRSCSEFDGIYDYLLRCGVRALTDESTTNF